MTSHVMVSRGSCPLRGRSLSGWPDRARTTARSCGWPSRRSSPWSPSRCSCSPTPPSSATSAPPSWPGSAIAGGRPPDRRSGCASSSPTAPPPASPAGSAPATCAARWPRASTGSGWRSCIGVVVTVAGHRPHRAAGRRSSAPTPRVADPATTYLRIAFLGTTPLLVMLAATGVLRGLQDTRTPLVVAVAGNAAQHRAQPAAGLRPGPGLGIAGSAFGSVLAQVASAAALRRGRGPGRPARGRVAAPRPARHPRRRPRRRSPWSSAPSPCGPRCCVTTYAVTSAPSTGATRRSTSPPTSSR